MSDGIEDIPLKDDFREDRTREGEIEDCHYCGRPLRVDYEGYYDILNCERDGCMEEAVRVNCL